ncbi:MAG: Acetylornithine deacetylase [Parcubacteria group bacterium GW2011_GWA2_40_23]|nr:MAG: Acetylornithine deacetylase [Parcubacteria group bacterium GW2011_GWA2_40_23]
MQNLELLKKLISFDSQSQNSNKEIVDFIASFFPADKVKITPLKNSENLIYNLEVKFEGQEHDKPLIFSGHTDTVPTSSKWTQNPFEPIVKDDKLFGLGSCDMKAGLTAMIQTALNIDKKPKQDIFFLFDCDEEVSGLGGRSFLDTVEIKPGSANVIVAEPTNCELHVGQKGAMEIKVTFYGVASHSADTNLENNKKNNAIHKAMMAYAELSKIEEELETRTHDLFRVPTQSICTIHGGTAPNVIPDECTFNINRRLLPTENIQEEFERIEKVILAIDKTAKVESVFCGDANLVSQDTELFLNAKFVSEEVMGQSKIDVIEGWTQAGLFKIWGNCLIWGPGDFRMAHQADEFVKFDQIDIMIECYKKMIQSLCF